MTARELRPPPPIKFPTLSSAFAINNAALKQRIDIRTFPNFFRSKHIFGKTWMISSSKSSENFIRIFLMGTGEFQRKTFMTFLQIKHFIGLYLAMFECSWSVFSQPGTNLTDPLVKHCASQRRTLWYSYRQNQTQTWTTFNALNSMDFFQILKGENAFFQITRLLFVELDRTVVVSEICIVCSTWFRWLKIQLAFLLEARYFIYFTAVLLIRFLSCIFN